jgi:hypothetical protein
LICFHYTLGGGGGGGSQLQNYALEQTGKKTWLREDGGCPFQFVLTAFKPTH